MRDRNCTLCKKLCENAKTVCMSGKGSRTADIMFLGEAPGKDEDAVGEPFVGKAGRFLERHIFRYLGIERKDVFIGNAVRCRPPNNKTPSKLYVKNCRKYLLDDIERIQPKVIVLLGNVPLHAAITSLGRKKDEEKMKKAGGMMGITKWRGNIMWHREFNCWVMPTFHPSALMRDFQRGVTFRLEQTREDVEKALKYITKKRPFSFEIPKAYWIRDKEKALKVIEGVMRSKVYSVDLETYDFDVRSPMKGIALTDRIDRGFYIDWEVLGKVKSVRRAIQKLISRDDRIMVYQNGSFDEKVFRMHGFEFTGTYVDTMIAAHLLDENFLKGLKELTWKYLHYGGYEESLEEYRRDYKINTFEEIPQKTMYPYACCDAAATLHLWQIFEPMLEEQGLMPLFTKVSLPVRRVMTDAEVYGFKVDIDRAKKLDLVIDRLVKKVEKRVHSVAGKEFNLNSRIQLSDVLFKDLRLNPLKRTKSGFSTDSESLEFIAAQPNGEIATWLLDRAYLKSQQSKFVKAVIEKSWDDGKIHTKYNITGTVTGRTSCSEPGIHNIPRDGAIRSLFTAEEGCVLVCADIKQAELRALAAYSGDPGLLTAFNEGRDIHSETYIRMFNKSSDYKPTDDERFIAKTVVFGLIYGRGPKSLAKMLGISLVKANRFIAQYFRQFPKAEQFLKSNIKHARRNGYVVSLAGRRRRLPDILSDDFMLASKAERQANNSIIQSVAADYTYVSLVRVMKELVERGLLDDVHIIHTVHDCIITNCREEHVEEVKSIITEQFEKRVKWFPVKMKVDFEVAKRWGETNDSRLRDVINRLRKKAA